MNNINSALSILREQVDMGIFESEEEAVEEYKIARERVLR